MEDIYDLTPDNAAIVMSDSPEYLQGIERMSEYIATLPLSSAQVQKLAELFVEVKNIFATDVFVQATELTAKIIRCVERGELSEVLN